MTPVELASLLASRICHDMVGPVGAIGNGLEVLAEDDPDMHEQAMDLLNHSSRQALARLKFFRLAFGVSGGGETILFAPAREATDDFFEGGRITLVWSASDLDDGEPMNKRRLRALLNMIIVVAEALPRGGRVTATVASTGGRLAVRGEGERARFHAGIAEALDGVLDDEAVEPRHAPALMLAGLATAMGGRLERAIDENRIELVLAT